MTELEAGGNVGNSAGNSRNLQQKIGYLEDVLKKLEKERSELSVRATMAEEQLKNMQEHMNSTIQNYQKKLSDCKRTIQQLSGGKDTGSNLGMMDNVRSSYY